MGMKADRGQQFLMNQPAMDLAALTTWHGLLQAENLNELSQHCLLAAASILGDAHLSASWLLLHDVTGRPPWWVLHPMAGRRGRYYLECPLDERLMNADEDKASDSRPRVVGGPLLQLLAEHAR